MAEERVWMVALFGPLFLGTVYGYFVGMALKHRAWDQRAIRRLSGVPLFVLAAVVGIVSIVSLPAPANRPASFFAIIMLAFAGRLSMLVATRIARSGSG